MKLKISINILKYLPVSALLIFNNCIEIKKESQTEPVQQNIEIETENSKNTSDYRDTLEREFIEFESKINAASKKNKLDHNELLDLEQLIITNGLVIKLISESIQNERYSLYLNEDSLFNHNDHQNFNKVFNLKVLPSIIISLNSTKALRSNNLGNKENPVYKILENILWKLSFEKYRSFLFFIMKNPIDFPENNKLKNDKLKKKKESNNILKFSSQLSLYLHTQYTPDQILVSLSNKEKDFTELYTRFCESFYIEMKNKIFLEFAFSSCKTLDLEEELFKEIINNEISNLKKKINTEKYGLQFKDLCEGEVKRIAISQIIDLHVNDSTNSPLTISSMIFMEKLDPFIKDHKEMIKTIHRNLFDNHPNMKDICEETESTCRLISFFHFLYKSLYDFTMQNETSLNNNNPLCFTNELLKYQNEDFLPSGFEICREIINFTENYTNDFNAILFKEKVQSYLLNIIYKKIISKEFRTYYALQPLLFSLEQIKNNTNQDLNTFLKENPRFKILIHIYIKLLKNEGIQITDISNFGGLIPELIELKNIWQHFENQLYIEKNILSSTGDIFDLIEKNKQFHNEQTKKKKKLEMKNDFEKIIELKTEIDIEKLAIESIFRKLLIHSNKKIYIEIPENQQISHKQLLTEIYNEIMKIEDIRNYPFIKNIFLKEGDECKKSGQIIKKMNELFFHSIYDTIEIEKKGKTQKKHNTKKKEFDEKMDKYKSEPCITIENTEQKIELKTTTDQNDNTNNLKKSKNSQKMRKTETSNFLNHRDTNTNSFTIEEPVSEIKKSISINIFSIKMNEEKHYTVFGKIQNDYKYYVLNRQGYEEKPLLRIIDKEEKKNDFNIYYSFRSGFFYTYLKKEIVMLDVDFSYLEKISGEVFYDKFDNDRKILTVDFIEYAIEYSMRNKLIINLNETDNGIHIYILNPNDFNDKELLHHMNNLYCDPQYIYTAFFERNQTLKLSYKPFKKRENGGYYDALLKTDEITNQFVEKKYKFSIKESNLSISKYNNYFNCIQIIIEELKCFVSTEIMNNNLALWMIFMKKEYKQNLNYEDMEISPAFNANINYFNYTITYLLYNFLQSKKEFLNKFDIQSEIKSNTSFY